jgi:hypothetical protein
MRRILFTYILLPLTALNLSAGELKIEWEDPNSFRDADYYYNGGDRSKQIVFDSLERFFSKQAERLLPEGSVLEMNVVELDLAGDFEPWNMPHNHDVRIIKRLYPAQIEFEYKYMDADGTIVAEGQEKLRDRNVPSNLRARSISQTENYPYIKVLVRDWIRDLAKS